MLKILAALGIHVAPNPALEDVTGGRDNALLEVLTAGKENDKTVVVNPKRLPVVQVRREGGRQIIANWKEIIGHLPWQKQRWNITEGKWVDDGETANVTAQLAIENNVTLVRKCLVWSSDYLPAHKREKPDSRKTDDHCSARGEVMLVQVCSFDMSFHASFNITDNSEVLEIPRYFYFACPRVRSRLLPTAEVRNEI